MYEYNIIVQNRKKNKKSESLYLWHWNIAGFVELSINLDINFTHFVPNQLWVMNAVTNCKNWS